MAPEQIRSGRRVDGRADLYAIGCVLHEMLTGRLPFPGKTTLEMFAAHLDRPAPAIARPDVPQRVRAAVARALAKNPDDRFADADAMRAALTTAPRGGGLVFFACLVAFVIVIVLARC
jgi:serine/threonine-protein kinase